MNNRTVLDTLTGTDALRTFFAGRPDLSADLVISRGTGIHLSLRRPDGALDRIATLSLEARCGYVVPGNAPDLTVALRGALGELGYTALDQEPIFWHWLVLEREHARAEVGGDVEVARARLLAEAACGWPVDTGLTLVVGGGELADPSTPRVYERCTVERV